LIFLGDPTRWKSA